MALTALRRTDYVGAEGRAAAKAVVRLTRAGRALLERNERLHAAIAVRWAEELGADVVTRLRGSLESLLDDPALAAGLRPPPGGWRAGKAYRAHTDALVADPRGTLPHAPMVLHRGGWPDGS